MTAKVNLLLHQTDLPHPQKVSSFDARSIGSKSNMIVKQTLKSYNDRLDTIPV